MMIRDTHTQTHTFLRMRGVRTDEDRFRCRSDDPPSRTASISASDRPWSFGAAIWRSRYRYRMRMSRTDRESLAWRTIFTAVKRDRCNWRALGTTRTSPGDVTVVQRRPTGRPGGLGTPSGAGLAAKGGLECLSTVGPCPGLRLRGGGPECAPGERERRRTFHACERSCCAAADDRRDSAA